MTVTDTQIDTHFYQIFCLEYQDIALYGEVIQINLDRNLCWFRPLALLHHTSPDPESPILYDLRQGPDLLCPNTLFRTAFDTEVLPILAQLESLKTRDMSLPNQAAQQQLTSFIHRLWQAEPDAFRQMHPSG